MNRKHAALTGTKVTVWPGYRYASVIGSLKATVQFASGGLLTVTTDVGRLVFSIADEGTAWVRGWNTPAAKALRATALLVRSAS